MIPLIFGAPRRCRNPERFGTVAKSRHRSKIAISRVYVRGALQIAYQVASACLIRELRFLSPLDLPDGRVGDTFPGHRRKQDIHPGCAPDAFGRLRISVYTDV